MQSHASVICHRLDLQFGVGRQSFSILLDFLLLSSLLQCNTRPIFDAFVTIVVFVFLLILLIQFCSVVFLPDFNFFLLVRVPKTSALFFSMIFTKKIFLFKNLNVHSLFCLFLLPTFFRQLSVTSYFK